MKTEHWRILEPGRVFVDYGPVSMVISAFREEEPLTEICAAAFPLIERTLGELGGFLDLLRRNQTKILPAHLSGISRAMYDAVSATGELTLTPMATVAGAMSDTVADWVFAQGATKVIVNNGGDIALRLADHETVRVGILSDLSAGTIDRVLTVSGEDGIGGVATSGLGGRSFTRGIASAVTVLSKTCRQADALATHLANCSYVDCPRVTRVKAALLDPTSDIGELDVVTEIGVLTEAEVAQGLEHIREEAMRQQQKGLLLGVTACVQGKALDYPTAFFENRIKEK